MTDYDALVVGSGIAGMESALKLGDMGYKVLLVEKEASVGGRMILLSKVFPTLDCAKRASRIVAEAQTVLKAEGIAPQRLKMAAICSVCAENFARHMNQFSEALIALRSTEAK